jgi:hypothetical protein
MWQAPNSRVRAIAQAKKREKERNRRPLHLKRVVGEIKVTGGLGQTPTVTQARVVLNDFSPKGVGVFSNAALEQGQEISLTLNDPKRFYARAKVVYCQEYGSESHIVSEQSYQFRVGLQFLFENDEEKKEVEKYCEELMKAHILPKPKAA